MGYVYLLHFDKPYKHAKHYIGYAEDDVDGRIERHRKGTGSKLISVIVKEGIDFTLAKVWENVDRNFERRLKNRGGASKTCPICKGQFHDCV